MKSKSFDGLHLTVEVGIIVEHNTPFLPKFFCFIYDQAVKTLFCSELTRAHVMVDWTILLAKQTLRLHRRDMGLHRKTVRLH